MKTLIAIELCFKRHLTPVVSSAELSANMMESFDIENLELDYVSRQAFPTFWILIIICL